VLCVELERPARGKHGAADRRIDGALAAELAALGDAHEHTRPIDTFLLHDSFPVDIRHNAKIFREKLAVWAAEVLA